ncbi:MAG: hypothetical protein ACPHP1_02870 [Miltoncostaeaceae bacterium]
MTSIARATCATAFAAMLAIPAAGLGAEADIRIEGTSRTVLPQTAYVLPAAGTSLTIRDTADDDVMSVGGRTAAAQLGNASRLYGIGFGFTDWGQFGFALDSIGSDPSDWNAGPAWFLKINHRASAVGAGSLELAASDEVLWALSPFDSNFKMALAELDVVGPTQPLPAGEAFTVRVDSYDNAGTRSPAAGATVTYRGATLTAGADGTATLTAGGSGPAEIVATRTGAVRDSARVCAHPAADPTVCDLPPLPKATMPDAPGQSAVQSTGDVRVPITFRTAGRTVSLSVEVPLPEPGAAPVAIRRQMLSGADLSTSEMRRAMGKVASHLAAYLNAQAKHADPALALPTGNSWRAAWLSGTAYVVPMKRNEALMGVASGGPRNTASTRARTGAFRRHIARCDLGATAVTVRRHGYALTTVTPASARSALVRCATRGRR